MRIGLMYLIIKIQRTVNDGGFSMYKFRVISGCYEIYGTAPKAEDNAAERIETEIYFHPISGDIVDGHYFPSDRLNSEIFQNV